MLILLPPSESKASPPARGRPVELDRLSFSSLAPTRRTVLDALIRTSAAPDALTRLKVTPGLAAEVERNTRLPNLPRVAVPQVYTGVLYDALGWPGLDPAQRRRARSRVVIISALWGALRPGDAVPPYRLSMGASLHDVGPLAGLWRPALNPVLTGAAGSGVIVDCRSGPYEAAWPIPAELAPRAVAVRVLRDQDGIRTVVSHQAKHTRGLVTRWLLQSGRSVRTVPHLVELLREQVTATTDPGGIDGIDGIADLGGIARIGFELVEPPTPRRPWTLDVVLTDTPATSTRSAATAG